jgi:hypothetical protein
MANNPRNVRQKTGDDDTLHISDLLIGSLVNVSEYLPKPSKVMLAVALSAPSSSWNVNSIPSDVSKAIISASQWDILDFEDVEKELANKLTDDDISAVLTCIGARDVLKKLKLYGCINFEGHGLNPLRGSVVLEQIDISLVRKHEDPQIEPTPKISHEIVLPILDGIISTNGCVLKYIQFPWKWRETYPVVEFRRRYNQQLNTRGISCSKCNRNMNEVWLNDKLVNTNICYDCLKPICTQCDMDEADFCQHCTKKYCTDCVPLTSCASCSNAYCRGCIREMDTYVYCDHHMRTCDSCDMTRCDDCSDYMDRCNSCGKVNCESCYDGEEYSVKYCDQGSCASYCRDCKLIMVKKDGVRCYACAGDVVPFLLEQNTKLTEENEELAKDNQEMREKVEGMSL